jgi:hypothetical protein
MSLQPSARPSLSITPSTQPSISSAPTELRREIVISPFVAELVSVNELPNVVDQEVADVAGVFLTGYLNEKLPSQQRFLFVELKPEEKSRGRRLNVKRSTACSGIAVFNSKEIPIASTIDEHILNAFSNPKSKRDFLNLLKDSGTSLSLVSNVGADLQNEPVLSVMQQTIIIVLAAVAVVAIGLSFFIQHRLKRGSEKRIKEYGLHYAAQVNEEDMKIDYLEPQPLGISDDDRAIERNLIRSQHERTVMIKANAKLKNRFTAVPTSRAKSIRFEDHLQYDGNGVVDELNLKDEDEEATISSIQFSNSMESSLSSLGGLNSVAENGKRRGGDKMSSSLVPQSNSRNHPASITCDVIQESPSVTSPFEGGVLSPASTRMDLMSTEIELAKDGFVQFDSSGLDSNKEEDPEGKINFRSASAATTQVTKKKKRPLWLKKRIGSLSPMKMKRDAKQEEILLGPCEVEINGRSLEVQEDTPKQPEIVSPASSPLNSVEDLKIKASSSLGDDDCFDFSRICSGNDQGIEESEAKKQDKEMPICTSVGTANMKDTEIIEETTHGENLREDFVSDEDDEDDAEALQVLETKTLQEKDEEDTRLEVASTQKEDDSELAPRKTDGENSYFTSIFTRRY